MSNRFDHPTDDELEDLLLHKLPSYSETAIEEHTLACLQCIQYLEETQALIVALRSLPLIHVAYPPTQKNISLKSGLVMAIAAAVILSIGLRPKSRSVQPTLSAAAVASVSPLESVYAPPNAINSRTRRIGVISHEGKTLFEAVGPNRLFQQPAANGPSRDSTVASLTMEMPELGLIYQPDPLPKNISEMPEIPYSRSHRNPFLHVLAAIGRPFRH